METSGLMEVLTVTPTLLVLTIMVALYAIATLVFPEMVKHVLIMMNASTVVIIVTPTPPAATMTVALFAHATQVTPVMASRAMLLLLTNVLQVNTNAMQRLLTVLIKNLDMNVIAKIDI